MANKFYKKVIVINEPGSIDKKKVTDKLKAMLNEDKFRPNYNEVTPNQPGENIHETAGFPMGVMLLVLSFILGCIVGFCLA